MKAKDIVLIVLCIAIIVGLAWFLKYVLQNGYDEIEKVINRWNKFASYVACKGRLQVRQIIEILINKNIGGI